ncbi:hypothetical protein CGRA01v4_12158 [Colletotrichum graminicola]|uniref:Celp0028 effector like protein n=1 Tax=Colletotrichum graminicola (strain M1.001 / M2 / FGSC 10212) TaxID=645133 RepID=E3QTA8_COLGM|nr:uncharacterized protein GLRG_09240 [Colletotrichum graminicola M1.001]EFQ34096.1 hypothetical protein GLRG_09240 [Colletotrichum graminicola M1.001]WDK20869.1 hypothetical protein CGRA01v4_12158 [Colletotrichum graminicola]
MVSTAFLSLIVFAAAVSASSLQPRILAADDIILLNHDGTSQIIKAAEYEALETAAATALAPASFPSLNITSTPEIARRHCSQSNEVQIMADDYLLESDVVMSPVVSSVGGGATVSIEDGFRLSEQLKIQGQITLGGPKIIRASLNNKFDMTWTSTQTKTFRYTLPPNMYGVIVSQPYVRRFQGFLLSGCTDNPTRTPFEAKTYESQSYGSLSWVKGVIRMCSSEIYPIPYCVGDGYHE